MSGAVAVGVLAAVVALGAAALLFYAGCEHGRAEARRQARQGAPATPKQRAYLRDIAARAGVDVDVDAPALTVEGASELIDKIRGGEGQ